MAAKRKSCVASGPEFVCFRTHTAIVLARSLANVADGNTAIGAAALLSNTAGIQNTAVGALALSGNTSGQDDTAVGFGALSNNTDNYNTAMGSFALNTNPAALSSNQDGFDNTAIGGAHSSPIPAASGHLGTVGLSSRFKKDIKPMSQTSEAILALKLVTFRYKKEIDPARGTQFGLVAEEVDKVLQRYGNPRVKKALAFPEHRHNSVSGQTR